MADQDQNFNQMKRQADLARGGWRQLEPEKQFICVGPRCRTAIQWWKTKPNNKVIPLTAATLLPHWYTCRHSYRNKPPVRFIRPIEPAPGNW